MEGHWEELYFHVHKSPCTYLVQVVGFPKYLVTKTVSEGTTIWEENIHIENVSLSDILHLSIGSDHLEQVRFVILICSR